MDRPLANVVLWIGPKHSGKSTAAARLVERATAEGFPVAGILAPAVYHGGALAGFDAVNVVTGLRRPLARRAEQTQCDVGPFAFETEGLRLGSAALAPVAARSAALVIVDEFGPLELRGRGWRSAVDRLTSEFQGVLLLVVRDELARDVVRLYARWRPERIPAVGPGRGGPGAPVAPGAPEAPAAAKVVVCHPLIRGCQEQLACP